VRERTGATGVTDVEPGPGFVTVLLTKELPRRGTLSISSSARGSLRLVVGHPVDEPKRAIKGMGYSRD
jgi:hypothetical protein